MQRRLEVIFFTLSSIAASLKPIVENNIIDRLKIINATAQKGLIVERIIPRAQGRATAKNDVLTHLEIVAQEV